MEQKRANHKYCQVSLNFPDREGDVTYHFCVDTASQRQAIVTAKELFDLDESFEYSGNAIRKDKNAIRKDKREYIEPPDHPYEGTIWDLKNFRNRDDGTLISSIEPGSIPVYYVDSQKAILCPGCANDAEVPERDWADEQQPVGGSLFKEGVTIKCDQCGKIMKSANG